MRNAAKHSLSMGPVNRFQDIFSLNYFPTFEFFLDKKFLEIVLLKKNFLNHIFVFITQLVIVASPVHPRRRIVVDPDPDSKDL
jgi:hypothetical protein